MTLLINEIRLYGNLKRSSVLFAADRRITKEGKFHSNRKKIFKIPYLNAGVGYFGLACLNPNDYFSSWLPNIIRNNTNIVTLEEFAFRLRDNLNSNVNKTLLIDNHSGFHVCGYNKDNHPELWFIRNIESMEGNTYIGFNDEYQVSEDFIRRDAKEAGFVNKTSELPVALYQYYVNGDVRPFHAIWKELDGFISKMFSQKDFKAPRSYDDLIKISKWKMQIIASFYKHFADKQLIGTPIDSFMVLPKQSV